MGFMKSKLAKDYYKVYISVPIQYAVVSALCILGFALTGTYTGEKTKILAIVMTCFMALATLWALIDVLTTPKRFMNKVSKMPDNAEEEVISGYEKGSKLGNRVFFENYILYYSSRSIQLLKYSDITSVEPKGTKLRLGLPEEKFALIPVAPDENPAVIAAALRSRNPEIAAIVNGRVIEIPDRPDKEDKDEKDKEEDNL